MFVSLLSIVALLNAYRITKNMLPIGVPLSPSRYVQPVLQRCGQAPRSEEASREGAFNPRGPLPVRYQIGVFVTVGQFLRRVTATAEFCAALPTNCKLTLDALSRLSDACSDASNTSAGRAQLRRAGRGIGTFV